MKTKYVANNRGMVFVHFLSVRKSFFSITRWTEEMPSAKLPQASSDGWLLLDAAAAAAMSVLPCSIVKKLPLYIIGAVQHAIDQMRY